MSYHRVEPYVWNDEKDMHIWSNFREGDTGFHSAVRVDLAIFDVIVVRRFCELIRAGNVTPAIKSAARKMGGAFEKEMIQALKRPQ